LELSCSALAPSVSCHVRAVSNELYCGGYEARDVTNFLQWFSTNPSAGHFVTPGQFQFTSPASTVIYAEGYDLRTGRAVAYKFGTDNQLRPITAFGVTVTAQPLGGVLALANVRFIQEGRDEQTCTQGASAPYAGCVFSVDELSPDPRFDLPPATVIASAPGYATVQRAVQPLRPLCETCGPQGVLITLSPAK
jgi:hypothetical protein